MQWPWSNAEKACSTRLQVGGKRSWGVDPAGPLTATQRARRRSGPQRLRMRPRRCSGTPAGLPGRAHAVVVRIDAHLEVRLSSADCPLLCAAAATCL